MLFVQENVPCALRTVYSIFGWNALYGSLSPSDRICLRPMFFLIDFCLDDLTIDVSVSC